jgi:hypothetical protein
MIEFHISCSCYGSLASLSGLPEKEVAIEVRKKGNVWIIILNGLKIITSVKKHVFQEKN